MAEKVGIKRHLSTTVHFPQPSETQGLTKKILIFNLPTLHLLSMNGRTETSGLHWHEYSSNPGPSVQVPPKLHGLLMQGRNLIRD